MITNDPLIGWLLVALYLPAFCAVGAIGWKVSRLIRRARRRRIATMPATYRGNPKHLDRWYAITPRTSGGRVRL